MVQPLAPAPGVIVKAALVPMIDGIVPQEVGSGELDKPTLNTPEVATAI